MTRLRFLLQTVVLPASLVAVAGSVPAGAQPADLAIPAATTDVFPPGVQVLHLPGGAVYANARRQVLYGLDMRTLLRAGPDPAQFCTGACAKLWEPLLAPAGSEPTISYPHRYGQGMAAAPRKGAADTTVSPGTPPETRPKPTPDWAVIAGAQGPQWAYKGWHLVFTRRGDRPASTAFDGAENHSWNTLKYLPPLPKLTAPANVQAIPVGDHYVLADKDGRALFTGDCAKSCSGWRPLAAGMASAPIGEWTVGQGDAPQWLHAGKPVFVSQQDDPKQVPVATQVLQP